MAAEPSRAGSRFAKVSQSQYLERQRADTAAGSGAPVPRGVDRQSMAVTSPSDAKAAFEMLDDRKEGLLNKAQARCWLRCMGWCLLDSELDAMLVGGEKTVARANRTVVLPERTKWGIHQLTEINAANQHRQNASLKQLQAALRWMSNNRPKLSRERLMELTTKEGGLSELDLNQLLAAVGCYTAKHLDVDQLAVKVFDRICDPPSMAEMSDLMS